MEGSGGEGMKNKVREFIEAWVEITDEDLNKDMDEDTRDYYAQFPMGTIKQEVASYMNDGGSVDLNIKRDLKRVLDRYEKKMGF
jgi:hypothetical protein